MARTGGKRSTPRVRPSARPAPQRPTLPTASQSSSGMGKKIIIGAAVLVALAVVVVVGITLAQEDETAADQGELVLPEVAVAGSYLPQHDPSVEDPAVGSPAPQVFSADFSGLPAAIEDDGTPKMIVFLAHWCSHCQREVPAVQAWLNDNGVPAGVDFVSVATSISDIRPNYPPDAWLEREGWTPRVVVDDSSSTISNAFGLSAFPYYVLVDGSGTVVRRIAGGIPPNEVGFILEALAAGG